MSDYAASWALSRQRLLDEISSLNGAQLNWKLHPECLSIGEMAIHVAGVETYFGSQLAGSPLDAAGQRLARSATEGVVVGETFPYPPAEITPELVASCFDYAKGIWEPLIQAADPEIRKKEIKSALGPMISGDGAFARLGFHSAYHQGQAYLIKTSPGFPS